MSEQNVVVVLLPHLAIEHAMSVTHAETSLNAQKRASQS